MRLLLLAVAAGVLFGESAWSRARSTQDFVFEGDTVFTRAQLEQALRRYDISLAPPIERTTADDAAYFLREFLFGQGFPDAEVDYRFDPGQVVFTLSEGPRFHIGHLDFSESVALTRERMEGIFVAEMRQQTRTPFGRLRFVESAVAAGGDQIRLALVQDGYLDAVVQATPEFDGPLVNLSVSVTEGRRYIIDQIRVQGGVVLPEVNDAIARFQNKTYRPGDEFLLRSQVQDILRRKGYFAAEVGEDAAFGPDDGTVHITLRITSGAPYRVGKVTVDGNRRTLTSAVLRRLGIKAGPYDATAIDTGVRRLWFSGAFADVDLQQTPAADQTVDLHLKLEEGPARQVSATLGYGEWDRAFAEGTFTDRNFFGTLNRFSLRGFISQRSHGVGATLSDPWFLQTNLIGTAAAFYVRQELPAFNATQYGGGVGVERKANDSNRTGWRVGYQWKTVTNSTVFADDSLDGAALNYTLGELSFQQTLDRRNDQLSPMEGFLLDWQTDLASRFLLGEISFARLSGQAIWYIPLRKIIPERPFVPFLILNHRAGLMLPYADTDEIPIQERFFLGGPDTVRSFQLDGMGPRDAAGNIQGGLAYLLGNVEIQWPIWKAFYLAAFMDVGNLSPTVQDLSWDETRIGVGLGGRIYTPLGAIRLDYGHNLIRKDGDPAGAWQFGFGFTF